MRYHSQSELGLLMGELLLDLERVRPGLPERASLEELRLLLSLRSAERLRELQRELCFDCESEAEAGALLRLYQRELSQILLPRYARLAHRQNLIERRIARASSLEQLAHALRFFVLGTLLLLAPLPIAAPWLPLALAALGPFIAPWLTHHLATTTYRRSLNELHHDLDLVGASLHLLSPTWHNAPLPKLQPR